MVRVGIFGVTGMVGRALLEVMEKRNFPTENLRVFASERSAGKELDTPFGNKTIENANDADFSALDIAFFAIGGGWPTEMAPKATAAGCTVIDNSSTFRYDDNVPLIIPEINADTLGESTLIANPNCTTAVASIPLWAIHQAYGLKKVIISSYQAVSGAGIAGIGELENATKQALNNEEVEHKMFAHPIAFNVIPCIDDVKENDYTKEEMKVVWETQKIFGDDSIKISSTCVRVPTRRAHAESIVVETQKEIRPEDVVTLFENTSGIELQNGVRNGVYPMPITASEKFDVEVGRIRQNLVFGKHGLEFFVCGDQIYKGAALNAVQIAELVVKRMA